MHFIFLAKISMLHTKQKTEINTDTSQKVSYEARDSEAYKCWGMLAAYKVSHIQTPVLKCLGVL